MYLHVWNRLRQELLLLNFLNVKILYKVRKLRMHINGPPVHQKNLEFGLRVNPL